MEDPFGKAMDGLTETDDKAKEEVVEVALEEETEVMEEAAVELEARTGQAGTK